MNAIPNAFLILSVMFSMVCPIFGFITLICLLLFFRIPDIKTNYLEGIVSPAYGKVAKVEEVMFDGKKYKKIVIHLTVFDVHVQYAPVTGTVKNKIYKPGNFNPITTKESSEKTKNNERLYTVIESNYGDVIVTQLAGTLARRIASYVNVGDCVNKQNHLGMIYFGSRVDLYVPSYLNVTVSEDEYIEGGTTIVAN